MCNNSKSFKTKIINGVYGLLIAAFFALMGVFSSVKVGASEIINENSVYLVKGTVSENGVSTDYYHASIKELLEKAPSITSITLLGDLEENLTFTSNSYVINLNGYTLTTQMSISGGSVEVTDSNNGKITNSNGEVVLVSGGVFTLNRGEISGDSELPVISMSNDSTVKIYSGNVKQMGKGEAISNNGDSSTLIIGKENGSIGDADPFIISNSDTKYAISNNNGVKFNFNGGSVYASSNLDSAIYNDEMVNVVISDGSDDYKLSSTIATYNDSSFQKSFITLNKEEVTVNSTSARAVLGKVEMTIGMSSTSTNYASITLALNAVSSGQDAYISISANIIDCVTIPLNYNITINLNNYALSCSGSNVINNRGILQINGPGSVYSTNYTAINNTGTLHIMDGVNVYVTGTTSGNTYSVIKNTGSGYLQLNSSSSTVQTKVYSSSILKNIIEHNSSSNLDIYQNALVTNDGVGTTKIIESAGRRIYVRPGGSVTSTYNNSSTYGIYVNVATMATSLYIQGNITTYGYGIYFLNTYSTSSVINVYPGATISTRYGAIYTTSGAASTITISGGTLKNTSSSNTSYAVIYIASTNNNLTISGTATISKNSATYYAVYSYSNVSITAAATITGQVAIYGTATLTINQNANPTITGRIYSTSSGTVTISSGTIINTSTTSNGGVYMGNSSATLIIGVSTAALSDTAPMILGGTYGIYFAYATTIFNYNNGSIWGKTGVYNDNGTPDATRSGATMGTSSIATYNSVIYKKVSYSPVAQVGSNYYLTLQDAINDASSTIYLRSNITECVTVPTGTTATLYLSGYTISACSNTSSYAITNNGTLWIEGTGTIYGTGTSGNIIKNTGSLDIYAEQIESILLRSSPSTSNTGIGINNQGGYIVGLTGVAIMTATGVQNTGSIGSIDSSSISYSEIGIDNTGSIAGFYYSTISNSTSTALYAILNIGSSANIQLSSGTITSSYSDGTISNINSAILRLGTVVAAISPSSTALDIYNNGTGYGIVNSATLYMYKGDIYACNQNDTAISGAIISDFTVANYEESVNSITYIHAFLSAAQANGINYPSLASAINAITSGTITVQATLNECITIPSGKTITLNLNGKTIYCSGKSVITNAGALTINGSGNIYSNNASTITSTSSYTLTIKNGVNVYINSASSGNTYSVISHTGSGTININESTSTVQTKIYSKVAVKSIIYNNSAATINIYKNALITDNGANTPKIIELLRGNLYIRAVGSVTSTYNNSSSYAIHTSGSSLVRIYIYGTVTSTYGYAIYHSNSYSTSNRITSYSDAVITANQQAIYVVKTAKSTITINGGDITSTGSSNSIYIGGDSSSTGYNIINITGSATISSQSSYYGTLDIFCNLNISASATINGGVTFAGTNFNITGSVTINGGVSIIAGSMDISQTANPTINGGIYSTSTGSINIMSGTIYGSSNAGIDIRAQSSEPVLTIGDPSLPVNENAPTIVGLMGISTYDSVSVRYYNGSIWNSTGTFAYNVLSAQRSDATIKTITTYCIIGNGQCEQTFYAAAHIGTTYYPSVQKAINTADVNTVVLDTNVNECLVFDEFHEIILDLNGKSLTACSTSNAINNSGDLTIKNSSSTISYITGTNSNYYTIYNSNKLNIGFGSTSKNINITSSNVGIYNGNSGNLYLYYTSITAGQGIVSISGLVTLQNSAIVHTNKGIENHGTLSFINSTIDSTSSSAIAISNSGRAHIYSGTITSSSSNATIVNGATLNMSTEDNGLNYYGESLKIINDGNGYGINNTGTFNMYDGHIYSSASNDTTITGNGAFNNSSNLITDYPESYVRQRLAAAKIGSTSYASVTSAINSSSTGAINIVNHVYECITNSRARTINLNDFTIHCDNSPVITNNTGGSLIINGKGNIYSNESNAIINYASLTIQDGVNVFINNATSGNSYYVILNRVNGSITINNENSALATEVYSVNSVSSIINNIGTGSVNIYNNGLVTDKGKYVYRVIQLTGGSLNIYEGGSATSTYSSSGTSVIYTSGTNSIDIEIRGTVSSYRGYGINHANTSGDSFIDVTNTASITAYYPAINVTSSATITIDGATIHSNYNSTSASYATINISNANSALTISGEATISKNSATYYAIQSYGDVSINGAASITGQIYILSSASLTIDSNANPTITGRIYSSSTGTVKIYSGIITNISSSAYTYGVYITNSNATLIIGNSTAALSDTIPMILGSTNGVYITNAAVTFEYYNGSIWGGTTSYNANATPDVTRSGATLITSTDTYLNVSYSKTLYAVANIGSTYFSRIQDAINFANESEISLINNVTECITIPSGKNITINLEGYTLTSCTSSGYTINNSGNLHIHGLGTINGTGTSGKNIYNSSSASLGLYDGVVLRGTATSVATGTSITNYGSIEIYSASIGAATGINNGYGGSVVITSGGSISYTISGITNAGTVEMYGGSISYYSSGPASAIVNNGGSVYLSAGTITSSGKVATIINSGTLTLGESSTYLATTNTLNIYNYSTGIGISNTGTLNFYRGAVYSSTSNTSSVSNSGTLNVTPGLANETSGSYRKTAVAAVSVGSTYYSSITSAISSNNSVTLVNNLHECVSISSGRTITINLNGKGINCRNGSVITNQGTVTVDGNGYNNSEIFSTGHRAIYNNGTMTIQNGVNVYVNGTVSGNSYNVIDNYGRININNPNNSSTVQSNVYAETPVQYIIYNGSSNTYAVNVYKNGIVTDNGMTSIVISTMSGTVRVHSEGIVESTYNSSAAKAIVTTGSASLAHVSISGTVTSKYGYAIYQSNSAGTANSISINTGAYVEGRVAICTVTIATSVISISGGTITSNGDSYPILIQSSSPASNTLNISGAANINSSNTYAIYTEGNLNITSNPRITGGIYTAGSANIIISRNAMPVITSSFGHAIRLSSTGITNIYNGSIISTSGYGIYAANSDTLNIGENEVNASDSKPRILGSTYGIFFDNSTVFNFYNGSIWGKTASYNNTPSDRRSDNTQLITAVSKYGGEDYYKTFYAVAYIGSTYYATLQGAINAAGSQITSIYLDANITECIVVPSIARITLYLNEMTLTACDDSYAIENSGGLVIDGNGLVEGVYDAAIYNTNGGHLYLYGGTYRSSSSRGTIINDAEAEMDISSLTLGLNNVNDVKIYNYSDDGYGIRNSGTVNMYGGNLYSTTNNASTISVLQSGSINSSSTLLHEVDSGYRHGYLAAAMVGTTPYKTIQAAISAITTSGTITVQNNVYECAINVPSGKTITLNINGKTIRCIRDNIIKNNGTLTINGSNTSATTDDNVYSYNFTAIINTRTLTIQNGVNVYVSGTTSGNTYRVIENSGTLNINSSSSTTSTAQTRVYAASAVQYIIYNTSTLNVYNKGLVTDDGKSTTAVIETTGGYLYVRSGGSVTSTSSQQTIHVGVSTINTNVHVYGTVSSSSGFAITHDNSYSSGTNYIYIYPNANIVGAGRAISTGTNSRVRINISGGTIHADGEYAISVVSSSPSYNVITISGPAIISADTSAINTQGHVYINAGSYGSNIGGISLLTTANLTISRDANPTITRGISTTGSGTITIYSGTIVNTSGNGIYLNSSSATLVLGELSVNANESPRIIGSSYGVYLSNSAATFNYYNGSIWGNTSTTYYGSIDARRSDANIATTTDRYNNVVYNKSFYAIVMSGSTPYGSLQDAIDAAGSTPTSLTLLVNISECISIGSDATITLNLNGRTLSCPYSGNNTIYNEGNLTINGQGNILGYIGINNVGIVSIKENVTIDAEFGITNDYSGTVDADEVSLLGTFGIENYGTITIRNSTIGTYGEGIHNYDEGIINYYSTYLEHAPGSTEISIYNEDGTINLYSGVIRGNNSQGTIVNERGIVNVGDANLYLNDPDEVLIYNDSNGFAIDNIGTVNMYGGHLYGAPGYHEAISEGGTINAMRSTFVNDELISFGEQLDIYYSHGYLAAAMVGTTPHNTIQAAIDAITTSGTITVQNNVYECAITIPSGKTITLNINGKTIRCAGNYIIKNNGTLIINGSNTSATTDDNIYSTNYTAIDNTGTLTIQNGVNVYVSDAISGNEYRVIENSGTININNSSSSSSTAQTKVYATSVVQYIIHSDAGTINVYRNGLITDNGNATKKIIELNQSSINVLAGGSVTSTYGAGTSITDSSYTTISTSGAAGASNVNITGTVVSSIGIAINHANSYSTSNAITINSGATITGKFHAIHTESSARSTITIRGGTITNNSSYGVIDIPGSSSTAAYNVLNIIGPAVITNSTSVAYAAIGAYSNVNILSNARITGQIGIYGRASLVISNEANPTIFGRIYTTTSGRFELYSGLIVNTETVVTLGYALWIDSESVDLTIGDKNYDVSDSVIRIIGATNTIRFSGNTYTFKYYNGSIWSGLNVDTAEYYPPYNKQPTQTRDDASIATSTAIYDDVTYNKTFYAVARAGSSNYYPTLQAAINDAKSTQTTITILTNITECVTVSSDARIALYLNDKTFTACGNSYAIENEGNLTIFGSGGSIVKKESNLSAIYNTVDSEATSSGALVLSGEIRITTGGESAIKADSTTTVTVLGELISNYTAINGITTVTVGSSSYGYNMNYTTIKSYNGPAISITGTIYFYNGSIFGTTASSGTFTTRNSVSILSANVNETVDGVTKTLIRQTLRVVQISTSSCSNLDSLQGALNCVKSSTSASVITMLTNIDENVIASSISNTTLNLNIYNLSPYLGNSSATINNTGNLIITANVGGTIHSSSSGMSTVTVDNYGTLTFSSGEFEIGYLNNLEGGTLTINGGLIDLIAVDNKGIMIINDGTINSIDINNRETGEMTINGGTITGDKIINNKTMLITYGNIKSTVTNNDSLRITGGKITEQVINNGTLTMSGGTITTSSTSISNRGDLHIKSGTVTSTGSYGINSTVKFTLGIDDNCTTPEDPYIKGIYGINSSNGVTMYDGKVEGTTAAFDGSVSHSGADNIVCVDKYCYTPIAKIVSGTTTKYYNSISSAVANASVDNTVTLLNKECNWGITISKNITIDLGNIDQCYNGKNNVITIQSTYTVNLVGTGGSFTSTYDSYFISTSGTLNYNYMGTTDLSLGIEVKSTGVLNYNGGNITSTNTVLDNAGTAYLRKGNINSKDGTIVNSGTLYIGEEYEAIKWDSIVVSVYTAISNSQTFHFNNGTVEVKSGSPILNANNVRDWGTSVQSNTHINGTKIMIPAARVNGVGYETVDSAISAASAGGTVEITAHNLESALRVNKNLTINLNGYTILTIISDIKLLSVTSNATVVINGNGGLLESTNNYAIENKGTKLTISSTFVNSSTFTAIDNYSDLEINSSTIRANVKASSGVNDYGIVSHSGTLTIGVGTTVSGTIGILNYGTLNSQGTIEGKNIGIQNAGGNVEILGGSITGKTYAIKNESGNVRISTNGSISSEGVAIQNGGNMIIAGGDIIGDEMGIDNTNGSLSITYGKIYSAYGVGIKNAGNAELVLGTFDGSIGNDDPVIQSHDACAVVSGEYATFKFYDGVLLTNDYCRTGYTGVLNDHSGEIITTVDATDGYNYTYNSQYVVRIIETRYTSLQDAISTLGSHSQTIILLGSIYLTQANTVSSSHVGIIDLAGYNIANSTITNNGTLSIINSNNSKEPTITTNIVNSGYFTAYDGVVYTNTITNNGTLNVLGGSIVTYDRDAIVNNSGATLTIGNLNDDPTDITPIIKSYKNKAINNSGTFYFYNGAIYDSKNNASYNDVVTGSRGKINESTIINDNYLDEEFSLRKSYFDFAAKVVSTNGVTNYYSSLQEAIDNLPVNGTISLLRDVNECITISSKSGIIDLNGNSIMCTGASENAIKVENTSNIEIINSSDNISSITGTTASYQWSTIDNRGTLVIRGNKVAGVNNIILKNSISNKVIYTAGTTTISNVDVIDAYSTGITIPAIHVFEGTFTASNSNVEAIYRGIFAEGGVVNILSGSVIKANINSSSIGLVVDGSSVQIGDPSSYSSESPKIIGTIYGVSIDTGLVNFYAGAILSLNSREGDPTYDGDIISTMDIINDLYDYEGREYRRSYPKADDVVELTYNGETIQSTSIKEAIGKASTDYPNTIKLLKNIYECNIVINSNISLTLDLNGFTLSCDGNENMITISRGSLIITNGTINIYSSVIGVNIIGSAVVEFDTVDIYNYDNSKNVIWAGESSNVTISKSNIVGTVSNGNTNSLYIRNTTITGSIYSYGNSTLESVTVNGSVTAGSGTLNISRSTIINDTDYALSSVGEGTVINIGYANTPFYDGFIIKSKNYYGVYVSTGATINFYQGVLYGNRNYGALNVYGTFNNVETIVHKNVVEDGITYDMVFYAVASVGPDKENTVAYESLIKAALALNNENNSLFLLHDTEDYLSITTFITTVNIYLQGHDIITSDGITTINISNTGTVNINGDSNTTDVISSGNVSTIVINNVNSVLNIKNVEIIGTITNATSGKMTITDSTILGSITTYGQLTINSSTVTYSGTSIDETVITNGGTMDINSNSTISGSIRNQEKLTIDSSSVTSSKSTAIVNVDTAIISNSTILGLIVNVSQLSNLTIENSTVTYLETSTLIAIQNVGTITIKSNSTISGGITNSYKLTIEDSTVTYALAVNNSGTAEISNSTILGSITNTDKLTINSSSVTNSGTAITNSGKLTINSGTIRGNNGIVNSGTLTIGKTTDNLSLSDIIITGTVYGVQRTNGTVNFYNGTVYGGTLAFSGTISEKRNINGPALESISASTTINVTLYYGTSNDYKADTFKNLLTTTAQVAHYANSKIVEGVSNPVYSEYLQPIVTYCAGNSAAGEIIILINVNEQITRGTGSKEVIINLNNFNITSSSAPTITNNGGLKIRGTGNLNGSILNNTGAVLSLVENVNISVVGYGIDNKGTVTIRDNVSINVSAFAIDNYGVATVYSGTLTSSGTIVYNQVAATVYNHIGASFSIYEGKIETTSTENYRAIENDGTLTVGSDGSSSSTPVIASSATFALYNKGVATINSAKITSSSSVASTIYNHTHSDLSTSATLYIYGGEISTNSIYAIHNTASATLTIGKENGTTSTPTITSTVNHAIYSAGEVTINSGNITSSTASTIYNQTGATLNVYGGKIETTSTTTTHYAIYNKGLATINSGNITSGSTSTIYNDPIATLNVYGGKIEITGTSSYYAINNRGTLTVGKENDTTSIPTITSNASHVIYNRGEVTINSGEINAGNNSSTIYNESGYTLSIYGGTIRASRYYAIYNATNATLNVYGGKIEKTASTTMSAILNNGALTLGKKDDTSSTPVITSNGSYAIQSNSGTFNYYNGEIRTIYNSSNKYSYYYSNTTFDDGGISEYTEITGGYYVTKKVREVAQVGSTTYNTIEDAIRAISGTTGTITLLKDVTETNIVFPANKTITFNVNSKILNHFFVNMPIPESGSSVYFLEILGSVIINSDSNITSYSDQVNDIMINVTGSLTIESGSITSKGANIEINGGTLTVGSTSGNGSSISKENPEISSSSGLAVNSSNSSSTFNFYNGILKSSLANVFSVFDYTCLNVRSGAHIEYSLSGSVYSAYLVAGSVININADAEDDYKIEFTGSSIDFANSKYIITVSTSNNVWTSGETLELVRDNRQSITCSYLSAGKFKCETNLNTFFSESTHLYNVTYSESIAVHYTKTVSGMVTVNELIKGNSNMNVKLRVINNPTEDNTATTSTNAAIIKDEYHIDSDGDIILISVLSDSTVNLNVNKLKEILYGSQYANLTSSINFDTINVVRTTCTTAGCVNVSTGVASATMTMNTGYIKPSNTDITYILYDYTPKLTSTSALNLSSVNTCEYGSDCNVSALSFKDYVGRDVEEVINTITYNGEVVDSIDTTVLGNYVVTSVAIDMFGHSSMEVVREYRILDTVAPVVNMSNSIIIVKKGHTYSDRVIEVSDNADNNVVIERVSNIDFNKVGSHEVLYRAIDSSGNETLFTVVVVIKESNNISLYIIIGLCLVILGLSYMLIYKRKKSKY